MLLCNPPAANTFRYTNPLTGKTVPFRLPDWSNDHPDFRSLDSRLDPNHLARRVASFVDTLDLTPFLNAYSGFGSPPFHPRYLLQVVLYETHLGFRSPHDWFTHAKENNPVRWLAHGLQPSRDVWYTFRDRCGPLLLELNRQMLQHALRLDITAASCASQDGSTFAANSSRHRLLSEETVRQRLDLLDKALACDDRNEPVLDRPAWMARRRGRPHQRNIYRRALQRLQEQKKDNEQKRACDRKADDSFRVSLGDPEAPLGLDKEGVYRPLYNVQYLRDVASRLILSYGVFAQVNDAGTFQPLMERAFFLLGNEPEEVLADTAYATGPHLAYAQEHGIKLVAPWQQQSPGQDKYATKPPTWLPKESFRWVEEEGAYICPNGERLELDRVRMQQRSEGERVRVEEYRACAGACLGCPLAAWCTPCPEKGRTVSRSEHEELFEQQRELMQTKEAQELYKKRKQTVELGFADSKHHRKFREFRGRGLERAEIEVGLVVLVNNGLIVEKAMRESAGKGKE